MDDEANAVNALVTLLKEDGLDLVSATRGEQALSLAEAKRPDVAVVDVQMPGMTGLELLGHLRQRYPDLPAIIMSGHMERHEGIAEAREGTDTAYVGKPVDIDELLGVLRGIAARRPGA